MKSTKEKKNKKKNNLHLNKLGVKLTKLTSEQAKYEEIDESGFTREPLAKELILELESRKEELVGQAAAQ